MKSRTFLASVVAAVAMTGAGFAQANLTAETASPGSAPGVSVLALAEVASKAGVADIQVSTGQTLTNSVQNVA